MDSYWAYACSQHPCESTYEYFERYKCYLDENPYHGFQFHELITHFLDGMLPEECYTLHLMAGKHLMDCTPNELWYWIEDRAARTRPCSPEFVQAISELNEEVTRISKNIDEVAKSLCELKNVPEPVQVYVDDEEVSLSMKDRDAEDDIMDKEFETLPVYDEPLYDEEGQLPMYDEEVTLLQVEENLQVVPVMSMEDDPEKECSSLPCPDIILKKNLVITRNPIILPLSSIFLSSSAQIGNHQVWCSLEKTEMHDPMVRTHMITQASDQVFDELCINWKTRKKSMGKVQNSVKRSNNHSGDLRPALAPMKLRPNWKTRKKGREVARYSSKKSDTHSREACELGPTRRPMKLHLNWKKRKKGKYIFGSLGFSKCLVCVQKNRSSFGWKPGWNLWKNVSHQVTRNAMKSARKFDGMHPWAPNI